MAQHSSESQTNASGQRRKRRTALVWWVVAGVVILVAAAAVVAVRMLPQQTDTNDESAPPATTAPSLPPASTEPQATPTPQVPAEIVIAGCAVLNPPAQEATDQIVDQWGADAFSPPAGEVGRAEFDQQFGPSAQATADKVREMRGCLYIFNFENGLYQYVSSIPAADQAALLEAVQADADFVHSTLGSAQIYAWGAENELVGTYYTIHAFMGEVWIAATTSTEPHAALGPVIDAMVAANPQLAG